MGIIKILLFRTPEMFAVITLKSKQRGLSAEWPKGADGMANSVNPDQSDLGLHCLRKAICPKT